MLDLKGDNPFPRAQGTWACPKCAESNAEAHVFCAFCGTARGPVESDVPPTLSGMELTSTITIVLVGLFLGFMVLIAALMFGGEAASKIGDMYAKVTSTPPPTPTPRPTASPESVRYPSYSVPDLNLPTPAPAPTIQLPPIPKFEMPAIDSTSSVATVISENANLRKTPAITGEVITIVPQGSKVTIVRQSGPWFRVSSGATTGWLHGNTIELDEFNPY